jgi:hypothetical protein
VRDYGIQESRVADGIVEGWAYSKQIDTRITCAIFPYIDRTIQAAASRVWGFQTKLAPEIGLLDVPSAGAV